MNALLDIDQLRTFVAITETGSFTRAADSVFKTQSAVSMQMKRLEERVGRPIFERDGRAAKLTEDGEKLLDYARRIIKLNMEAINSFRDNDLEGRVGLGVPDDYVGRYLPELMARFSRANPRVEVEIVCEPTDMLAGRIQTGELNLAIITHVEHKYPAQFIRQERLLWVTSSRHCTHQDTPLPLALGRPSCLFTQVALQGLEAMQRVHRVLYTSWSSMAVGSVVVAGLAVSVLPESAVRPGMRILGPADGFPPLPSCKIGLLRSWRQTEPLTETLASLIVNSLENLSLCEAAE